MKKNVVLITALAVFAVALTVVYFLVLNKGDKEPEEEKPGYYTIRTIEAESIDRITLKTEGFDGGFLLRDGTWVNREDASVPVKQETLNLMVSIVLAHLNAFEKVENPPASEDFGFQNPAAVLTAYAGDNSLVTLRVGKSTPTRDRYYAMVDGDDSIYIVSDNYYKYIVKNRADFFEDIKLPEIADRDLLREISVSGEGRSTWYTMQITRSTIPKPECTAGTLRHRSHPASTPTSMMTRGLRNWSFSHLSATISWLRTGPVTTANTGSTIPWQLSTCATPTNTDARIIPISCFSETERKTVPTMHVWRALSGCS